MPSNVIEVSGSVWLAAVDRMYAEVDRMYAEGDRMYAEGDRMYAEGDRKYVGSRPEVRRTPITAYR